jgi:methylmalonyl-CoA carboxyltransferase large subunit
MAQNVKTKDLLTMLEEMRSQIADLAGRVARLEAGSKTRQETAAAVEAIAKPAAPKPAVPPAPAKQEITEEEILAVSAALGAYLGVRVHIRQMRLLSSSAWAQQGRVLVQAHIPYTH